MTNVLLCCTAGITTSLLVGKLQTEIAARELDMQVEACPLAEAVDRLDETDLMLLGPQVGYAKGDFEQAAAEHGARVGVITPDDYARMNAPGIVDEVLAYLA